MKTRRKTAEARSAARGSARTGRLLEDLESIVLHEGFLHLRTDELAKRLRCSKRTLYRLAKTREELFELVIENWLTRIRDDGLKAIRSSTDVPSAVTGYLDAAVKDTRDASSSFVRDLARFPAGTRRLMLHQRKRIAGLEKLIDEGVREGVYRGVHARLVAEVMLVAVARVVDPDLLARCDLTMSQGFEELYNIFEIGLSPIGVRKQGAREPRAPRRRAGGSSGEGARLAFALAGSRSGSLLERGMDLLGESATRGSGRRS